MKKTVAWVLTLLLVLLVVLTGCGSSGERREVNVCSWGEYIDESLID